jgi:hypothetical protein
MTTHPGSQEADIVLRDGSTVHVRPARPSDARAMKLLLTRLSDRSRWLRFFSAFPNVPKAARWATESTTTAATGSWQPLSGMEGPEAS